MRAIFNVSVGSDGQSHKTVSTNHSLFEEKGEPFEAVSNRGPSAYQPNSLPLGQTGSLPPHPLAFIPPLELVLKVVANHTVDKPSPETSHCPSVAEFHIALRPNLITNIRSRQSHQSQFCISNFKHICTGHQTDATLLTSLCVTSTNKMAAAKEASPF